MITIQIDTRQAQNMLTGMHRNLPKAMGRGMNKFTERVARKIREEAKARGHYTTGYLSGKKGTHADKIAKNVWAVKMPYYDTYLEKGTSPHFIPRNRVTELWAKRHGMSFSKFKWIVATRGTKPHPFTSHVLNRELKRLRGTVSKELNKTIKSKGRR